jgi:hypothetical protein
MALLITPDACQVLHDESAFTDMIPKTTNCKPGMMLHACNPSTQKTEDNELTTSLGYIVRSYLKTTAPPFLPPLLSFSNRYEIF